MSVFNFILWDVSPEIFSIGSFAVRWYGLFFALGFLLGQQILIRIYKQEGKSEKHVDTLTVYMVIATIIGARLGHCLFYEPAEFLANPIEIFKVWKGGLASHGATVGILIAIYLYSKKQTDQSYLYVLDRMVITIAFAGCLIRLGNLMNSEIIGKPANISTAFIFAHDARAIIEEKFPSLIKDVKIKKNGVDSSSAAIPLAGLDINIHFKKTGLSDSSYANFIKGNLNDTLRGYASAYSENVIIPDNFKYNIKTNSDGSFTAVIKAWGIPRYPSQLYEAISNLMMFFLLFYIYNRKKGKTPEGRLFSLFVIIVFGLRFFYEFLKEPQVDFENDMFLNMGQLLSIPLVIAGLFILMKSFRKKGEIS
jgi:phosphatidylglycerol---prolipoprotein diacylglyceryl transferase